ncbi:MAG: 7-cyano-7-deazaguanine synthase QueC [Eubacterium sp.]|nr:7-cyano-7-deazaguanine synthase QueC [Eubacterium sp.]
MSEVRRKNMTQAVVVYSGGQDSTTCLAWALKNYEKVYALSFDYGQRHAKELECAAGIAKKLGAEHRVISLKELNQLAANSLTRSDIPVDSEKPEGDLPNTYVEGRNLLFLTYAAIFAKTHGISDIITGVSQSDFSGYPDCRDVFIKSLNTTLDLAMDFEFCIITPLMWIDKEATWKMADELGVFDIVRNETLTCYNGIVGDGCGNCPACKLRKNGLMKYLEKKDKK